MKINLKDIVHIQRLQMEIFEYEDDDYGYDNRIIANKQRGIDTTLGKITDDKEKQLEILECIYHGMWDTSDNTYRPICNRLRAKGYEIVKESKCLV